MSDLGAQAASGTSQASPIGSAKSVFGVRGFVFKRQTAARKANEMKKWPHLEAIAVTKIWLIYLNSGS